MIYVGIDPGMDGALVALDGPRALLAEPLSTAPKVGLLIHELWRRVSGLVADYDDIRFVIERAQSFPGMGVSGAFNYGRDFGAILGVVDSFGRPYETVPPATWHKALCGAKRPGEGRPEAKARAAQVVAQRLPSLVLPKQKAKREGVVDAACLALWGQRVNGGGA